MECTLDLIFKISEAVLQLRELGENEIEVDSCGDTEGLYRHKVFKANKTICEQPLWLSSCKGNWESCMNGIRNALYM